MPTPAATILNQINAIDPSALWDWGARTYNPVAANDGLTLRLKSSGYVPWKGFIEITLDRGADLYDIEFYRMRRPRRQKGSVDYHMPVKKVDHSVTGVFVSDIVSIIDRQVLKRI